MSENYDKNKNVREKIDWLEIRTRAEEILELVLFLSGIVLTVLISSGILSWGAFGIGICACLIFIGISRFVATNSWLESHNAYYFPEQQRGWREDNQFKLLKTIIAPLVFVVIGITLIVLGSIGILSLDIGLGLGINLVFPAIFGIVIGVADFIISCKTHDPFEAEYYFNILETDNYFGICTGISGIIATVIFLSLGLGGIFSLSTAVALAAPLFILGVTIALIFLAMFVISKTDSKTLENLKNILKNDKNEISFLGLGYFAMKTDEGNEEPGKLETQEVNKNYLF